MSEVRLVLRYSGSEPELSATPPTVCDSELVRTSVSSSLSAMPVLESSHKGVKQGKVEEGVEFVQHSVLCELSVPRVLVTTPM